MPKRMLIDAGHPEETRVVVLDGNKVEEFDFESASKRPLKGNIYLAKVTRVEPSLQAAFVEYGGNRQGFLAFSEIHPDYYQIPMADRQALIEAQARRLMAEDEFDRVETATVPSQETVAETAEHDGDSDDREHHENHEHDHHGHDHSEPHDHGEALEAGQHDHDHGETHAEREAREEREDREDHEYGGTNVTGREDSHDDSNGEPQGYSEPSSEPTTAWDHDAEHPAESPLVESEPAESGANAPSTLAESTGVPQPQVRRDARQDRYPPRPRRRVYKIQEVIKRRQIMLVQVVKEERGTKGASLTTFLSLAGRYCVLMPNTPRGGGISRKITSATDRKRLKSAAQGLELPEGMGLIIRTAGATRTKVEIKRDYEYLLRQWDSVRELTLKSNAPALVYEEGNLIKRVIRDLYGKDISEVVVDGDAGYRDAKDFMKMILPSHAKNVKPYKDSVPLFQRHHVEAQLDQMFSPTVTLKSGGYIVINQTEALVSIDVNSGKATREHSIEETAHKTNLEAADEIGRQLRLRDLAGLIVIDFIDMEDGRNDRNVEKRIRDATKNDRARVQIGKISQFGLLEMSRQRLRAGVIAGSTVTCPHCAGQGLIRSTESAALRLLRALDEEGQHHRTADLKVKAPPDVTIYTLNQKRSEIARIELAHDLLITFDPQVTMMGGSFEIERTGTHTPSARPAPVSIEAGFQPEAEETESETVEVDELDEEEDITLAEPPDGTELEVEAPAASSHSHPSHTSHGGASNGQPGTGTSNSGKRRRRRGGRGRGSSSGQPQTGQPQQAQQNNQQPRPPSQPQHAQSATPLAANGEQQPGAATNGVPGQPSTSKRRRRRRGRGGSKTPQTGAPQNGNNGDSASSHATPTTGSHHEHEIAQRVDGSSHSSARSEERPAQADAVVNAPSSPQWSFVAEAPSFSHPAATATKSEPARAAPEPAVNAPLPEAGAPEQKRGGWWQRRFKSET